LPRFLRPKGLELQVEVKEVKEIEEVKENRETLAGEAR
jgi:hypothetical protein